MNAELLLKAVADSTRLKILSALLDRAKFVEEIAKELNISESTVSFHLKKLQAADFVMSKKEQYYQIYSLNLATLDKSLFDFVKNSNSGDSEAFKREVLIECFAHGKLISLPVQIKKREVIFSEIIKLFKPNKIYSEREINIIIADVFDDFILIRNELLRLGYLNRFADGFEVKKRRKTKKQVDSIN